MVAVGEDGAAPLETGVQPARDADGEALHALGQRSTVVSLDDEVQVVSLDGVVGDAHAQSVLRVAERLLQD